MSCHEPDYLRKLTLPVAVHVALLSTALDDRVLLLRRRNTGFGDGRYGLPAGHLEPAESVRAAAARELREEVGVEVRPDDLELTAAGHRRGVGADYVDFFFTARQWSGRPLIGEPDRCDEVSWHPRSALPADTLDYVRSFLTGPLERARLELPGW